MSEVRPAGPTSGYQFVAADSSKAHQSRQEVAAMTRDEAQAAITQQIGESGFAGFVSRLTAANTDAIAWASRHYRTVVHGIEWEQVWDFEATLRAYALPDARPEPDARPMPSVEAGKGPGEVEVYPMRVWDRSEATVTTGGDQTVTIVVERAEDDLETTTTTTYRPASEDPRGTAPWGVAPFAGDPTSTDKRTVVTVGGDAPKARRSPKASA